ncbi:MAG: response regulator [Oscillospiraceae bacterium]|jgi:PleD family two-component response regulator|nr:response regulator [Oscillospiraceae bacterium]
MDTDKKGAVLICEDDRLNQRIISHILGEDYTLHICDDGESALEQAARLLPDLILLDIVLPGIDGFQVLAALKESDATADIPVVFMSGLDGGEDIEKGFALRADDFMAKPVNEHILRHRVSREFQFINQRKLIERLKGVITEMKGKA